MADDPTGERREMTCHTRTLTLAAWHAEGWYVKLTWSLGKTQPHISGSMWVRLDPFGELGLSLFVDPYCTSRQPSLKQQGGVRKDSCLFLASLFESPSLSFIDLRVGRTRQMNANAGREPKALITVRLTPLPRSPESVVMDAVAVMAGSLYIRKRSQACELGRLSVVGNGRPLVRVLPEHVE
ncbi:hypothetical protein PAAG_07487 [Paracoccidioides lutzii Pb01]|uniref:Uncharacterized protein n=1 Tax=Paracoccidioides lutzii (strain ATCC MYA-826 / Pb01) TaxID=502779 RepID=C1H9P6_PARBA|nr:hypothetical protein PAAG_07487 [Paracoccidioides lutzii Pb01]EEH37069.1 hypothetical protein PAAG_07487 [Paracoccidioides lutzii Pb01]